jgi:glucose/mannose transport system substrate-binding protein
MLVVYTFLCCQRYDAWTALTATFNERYPQVGVMDIVAAQDLLRDDLARNVADGYVPDTFQTSLGTDFASWPGRTPLTELDSLAAAEGWTVAIPSGVLDRLRGIDGHLDGVPLSVDQANVLFYDKRIFDRTGVAPPRGFADYSRAVTELEATGVAPLVIPSVGGRAIATLLFDDVLVATAGPAFVSSYLSGKEAADAEPIRNALSIVVEMIDHSNADRTSIGYYEAASRVCAGGAAMTLLPAYLEPAFIEGGCNDGDIGVVPIEPASSPTFVFEGIAFPVATLAPHRDMAMELIRTMGSTAGQEAFNVAWRGIPARVDADRTRFTAIERAKMDDLARVGTTFLLSYEALAAPEFQAAVIPALMDMVDSASANFRSVDPVIVSLKQSYPLLQRQGP